MGSLAQRVAVLEHAAAKGMLQGRDLEVIETQLARAEEKALKLTRGSALAAGQKRTFLAEAA